MQRDGIGRIGREWLSLIATSRGAVVHTAFGLPYPIPTDHDDVAQALALAELGICEASVIAEPRYKRSARKAARDQELERDTIHQSPLWRYAERDERGQAALILPVGSDGGGHERPLSLIDTPTDNDFASRISDLIAIPLDGARPLSFTGHTLAVGSFSVDEGSLRLNASPMEWLKAHLARVRQICEDTPPHLVERLCFPVPPPDHYATLLIEPRALEWRVTSARCVIPHAAREILVPDSLIAARLIDGLMRQKERARPLPTVRGPKAVAA